MGGNGSKVWVDPASPNGATWVEGESVDLNGTARAITGNGDGSYSLDVTPLNEAMYAVYPATTASDGNDITVENSNASGSTITLKSLAVDFSDGGSNNDEPETE